MRIPPTDRGLLNGDIVDFIDSEMKELRLVKAMNEAVVYMVNCVLQTVLEDLMKRGEDSSFSFHCSIGHFFGHPSIHFTQLSEKGMEKVKTFQGIRYNTLAYGFWNAVKKVNDLTAFKESGVHEMLFQQVKRILQDDYNIVMLISYRTTYEGKATKYAQGFTFMYEDFAISIDKRQREIYELRITDNQNPKVIKRLMSFHIRDKMDKKYDMSTRDYVFKLHSVPLVENTPDYQLCRDVCVRYVFSKTGMRGCLYEFRFHIV